MKTSINILSGLAILLVASSCTINENQKSRNGIAAEKEVPSMKMTTETPQGIVIPDNLESRIGTLTFEDGMPTANTAEKLREYLTFNRAVDIFLDEMAASSMYAMRKGLEEQGVIEPNQMGIFETLMDSKSLWLTPNTETVYASKFLDLKKNSALVIEAPAKVLGLLDDAWMRHVGDIGITGPDKGQGGKYLILAPDYEGAIPEGYHVYRSKTYGNWFLLRGYLVNGDPKPAVENIKNNLKIYPLTVVKNPPKMEFVNLSGVSHNTIHPNNYEYFLELDELVQEEFEGAISAEAKGRLALLGIEKGRPFQMDENLKNTLNEAALVGAGIARTISFASEDELVYFYDDDNTWFSAFTIGNHKFLTQKDWVHRDARSMFMYNATGITPAMVIAMVGAGSQYAAAVRDANGEYLKGNHTYKLTLPANIPAKDFWSVLLYDTQTRAMLQTDQQFPSISNQLEGVKENADGTTDVYFGPEAPKGMESNWVQTDPNKGFWLILRLYGPLESWFDQTWRPGKIEKIK